MINLRGYQNELIGKVYAAWQTVRSVLAVLPTGGGKTVCFAAIMHQHVGACAAVVHRKEIVGQISMALARLGLEHRIVAQPATVKRIRRAHLRKLGKSYVNDHAAAGVVSVQTLTSKGSDKNKSLQNWIAQISLAVFDEGHHYVTQGLWAKAVELVHRAKLLFVTATPERADGKGLGVHADGFADVMVEGPSTEWLMRQGYLCGFRYVAPETDFDVSDLVATASGDLSRKELRARVVKSGIVGDVVTEYQKRAAGKQAIVFATDVKTAEDMAAAYNAAGIPAAALSGETDQGERDHKLDLFEAGTLKVLVNVDLFDEGFDVPAVEVVIMARPTESLAKYLQMVGRALRVIYAAGYDLSTAEGRLAAIAASSKPNALVLDMVRNWERLKTMPNWPRQWTLDGRPKSARGARADTIPQRVCVECSMPYEQFYVACPHCGAEHLPEGRDTPEQVVGDLFELDVEALARLFKELSRADMSDDEFRLDQIRRDVHPLGRAADLKRHQAAKYRRKVLHELVAWWVGCQPPGRSMKEKHRRFYLRFGTDIGTAFKLNAADTDALIAKITQRFSEDIAA